jgi:histone H3/H4
VELCRRKTICTSDVVWALNRQGRTIYVSTT